MIFGHLHRPWIRQETQESLDTCPRTSPNSDDTPLTISTCRHRRYVFHAPHLPAKMISPDFKRLSLVEFLKEIDLSNAQHVHRPTTSRLGKTHDLLNN